MTRMTKVSIVTPVWERPFLTALYCEQMTRHVERAARFGIELRVVIVGSEGPLSAAYCRGRKAFDYVEFPNRPLGAKFNAGVRAALRGWCDYVLIMGSDQFFLPTIWPDYAEAIRAGREYVATESLYMWDQRTAKAVWFSGYTNHRKGFPIGPGRLIHRRLLEPLQGRLYDDPRDRSLDVSADDILPAPLMLDFRKHLFCSVKTSNSLTSIRHFRKDTADVPASELARLVEAW